LKAKQRAEEGQSGLVSLFGRKKAAA
jgi:hypothetical protein